MEEVEVNMVEKIKRIISLILVIITLTSIIPVISIPVEASDDGEYVGSGGGNSGATGSGAFTNVNSGYRLWLMDDSGNQAADTNIVDLRNRSIGTHTWVQTFNTKIQPWTGESPPAGKAMLFSELDSTHFKGELPRPLISVGSEVRGQGEALRDWLTEGKVVVQPSFSTGGGSNGNGNYKYQGKPTGDTGSTGNTSQPAYSGSTVQDLKNTIKGQYDGAKKTVMVAQSQYTRAQACLYISNAVSQLLNSMKPNIDSESYSVVAAYAESLIDNLESSLTYTGWKDSKSTDASHFIQSPFDIAYAKSDWIKVEDDGTLTIDFFDIAHAEEESKSLQQSGNIYPLLNDNNLFDLSSLPIQMTNQLDTIAANNLKLIIEPIVWFQPAKVNYDAATKTSKIGGSPSWWFYGTPTTYASLMEYNKAHGDWHDGGSGGWYSTVLNKATSVSLYLNLPLEIENNTKTLIKAVQDNGSKIQNATLQRSDLGYAMHYVLFANDGPGIPTTHTYDYSVYDPNNVPHPAPDPSPDKIPLVPGEPEEPGDPRTPDNPNPANPGYKNITRNIHIVKVYDILHDDGTLEHVSTHDRDFNPGSIVVEHEVDYKCVGYFTSEVYFGWAVQPITTNNEWRDFRNNYAIPINPKISWETSFDSVSGRNAKDVAGTVKIGLAADPNFDPDSPVDADHPNGQPKDGYYDTTLYVHLVKKEKIPETSTYDDPDYPPKGGNQPYIDPHPSEDPKPPNIPNDPETDPGKKGDTYVHYRIVKVYETEYENEDGELDHIQTDYIGTTYETNPIVYIQDEGREPTNPNLEDKSWHLREWYSSDYFRNVKWNQAAGNPIGTSWEGVKSQDATSSIQSGSTEAKVDLRQNKVGKGTKEEVVTLYVRLVRIVKPKVVTGAIIIQQSQISKTIHTNDKHIGGKFGSYSFAMTVGGYATVHYVHQNHGCCRGHKYCDTCHGGHPCGIGMPGSSGGDNELNFIFDQTTAQDSLEIKTGVNSNTDPMVYGAGADNAPRAVRGTGISYPKKIWSLSASDNVFQFNSDGRSASGAEYVTVLWRGANKDNTNRSDQLSPPPDDIPTLALYKQKDITTYMDKDNYQIPYDMITKNGGAASKVSAGKRHLSTDWVGDLELSFGVHPRSDLEATSSCSSVGNECPYRETRSYYAISGTKLIWGAAKQDDFYAGVGIRLYKGTQTPVQTAPLGAPGAIQANVVTTGQHTATSVFQGESFVNFYSYIHMTYMVNKLEDAIKEEKNTEANGYNKTGDSDVRSSTYVLSEFKSSVLPADAVEVSWVPKKNNGVKEALTLSSQQWSVHQRATDTSLGKWQGLNQVLPGGAIFQVSIAEDNLRDVHIKTYQTVVDEKARSEYLAEPIANSEEYTEEKIVEDHESLINTAKEVLDNLKVVQWASNKVEGQGSNKMAWPDNFDESSTSDGSICLRGLGENISELTPKAVNNKASTEDKYYLRANATVNIYTSGDTKLADKTYEERQQHNTQKADTANEGDLDIVSIGQVTKVFKLFTDTSGNVYLAKVEKSGPDHMNNLENDIKSMISSLKNLNADSYLLGGKTYGAKIQQLCDKTISGEQINKHLEDTQTVDPIVKEAKDIDDKTKFITNFVSALTRNQGNDKTAEWVGYNTGSPNKADTKWYNEAFDGVYMVLMDTTITPGLVYSPIRVAALDPALCPPNSGQSNLFSTAFLSQFCLDSQSDAKVVKRGTSEEKIKNYIGTFRDIDLILPDMETMYYSKKFYIPNANVQDLN